MDKYFICLANSYKHGGRCVAGIELSFDENGKPFIMRHPNGRPRWIRPISNEDDGAIPNEIAQNIKLFSVIKLIDAIPCPNKAHVEDTKYSQMECQHGYFTKNDELLKLCLDNKHQNIFYFRGKAIPATMIERLDYSLMLIKPEKAQAYIDEGREKSKYRMRFSYYGSNYDFPITDPVFLEAFKQSPDSFSDMQDVFLTLSLGMEFEGFHFKLVAAVLNFSVSKTDKESPKKDDLELSYMEHQKQLYSSAYAKWNKEEDALLRELYSNGVSISELMKRFGRNEGAIRSRLKKLISGQEDSNWFDKYDEELSRLIESKREIDQKMTALRQELIQQMETRGEDKICTQRFTISYTPSKTVLKFDCESFREENEELYASYCKPIQKKASIMVRTNKP